MEDNTWIVLKGEIEEFLEKGEVDPHIKTIVELNLRVGEVEPTPTADNLNELPSTSET